MPPGEVARPPRARRGGVSRQRFRSALSTLRNILGSRRAPCGVAPGLAYWEDRARRYGARAALHLGHPASEVDAVTRRQRERLLPALSALLRGDERLALDFGCGPGRFTPDLARRVGSAIGVDPIERLLALAPSDPDVEYRLLRGGRIPVADAEVDVAWVCLVLGGLRDEELEQAGAELRRVLAPGGLLFLVENTSERCDAPHWRFRSCEAYRTRLAWARLELLGEYDDLGERVSILAGRRLERS